MGLGRNLTRIVAVAFLALAALVIMPSFAAEDTPKQQARDKETDRREVSGANAAEQSRPGIAAKTNVPISSKAVLLGAGGSGNVTLGIIVRNKSARPVWLPRMFESVTLDLITKHSWESLHMDGGTCRFPDNYFKLGPDGYYVYDIDLPCKTLQPAKYKVIIWAPARQKSGGDSTNVIVERIEADLDLQALSAILRDNRATNPDGKSANRVGGVIADPAPHTT